MMLNKEAGRQLYLYREMYCRPGIMLKIGWVDNICERRGFSKGNTVQYIKQMLSQVEICDRIDMRKRVDKTGGCNHCI